MQMNPQQVEFSVHEGRLCIAKLPADTEFQGIRRTPSFFSLTCAGDEHSVVADESFSHKDAQIERGWRALKVKGPLEFELKGILASLLNPLNEAEVSVFALSTFSTDYIFVKSNMLDRAVEALTGAGHRLVVEQA